MSRLRLVVVALATVAASLLLGASAVARSHDRNHDRIPDRWEQRHHLSLQRDQARRDQDRDGLRNRGEFKAGLNPRDADSDDDGVEDGDEHAGTVTSFDGRTLVIALAGGGSLTGAVDADTEVECDRAAAHSTSGRGDDDTAGHDRGDDRGGDEAHCGSRALTAGARVAEAELRARRGTATFEEVELAD